MAVERNPLPNMRPNLDQAPAPQERLIKATVAGGRSVMIGVGKKLAGIDRDNGREIWVPITKQVIEGEEVELPESDVIRMRASGYLVDPNVAPPLEEVEGPRIVKSEDRNRPGLVERRIS